MLLPITLTIAGAAALLNIWLARRVGQIRLSNKISIGDGGNEALTAFYLSTASFDLILMDIQMPNVDGVEATGVIRARELGTSAHVPIVALTASAMLGEEARCLAAGMDAFFTDHPDVGDLARRHAAVSPALRADQGAVEAASLRV